jgi:hypothetical protein
MRRIYVISLICNFWRISVFSIWLGDFYARWRNISSKRGTTLVFFVIARVWGFFICFSSVYEILNAYSFFYLCYTVLYITAFNSSPVHSST